MAWFIEYCIQQLICLHNCIVSSFCNCWCILSIVFFLLRFTSSPPTSSTTWTWQRGEMFYCENGLECGHAHIICCQEHAANTAEHVTEVSVTWAEQELVQFLVWPPSSISKSFSVQQRSNNICLRIEPLHYKCRVWRHWRWKNKIKYDAEISNDQLPAHGWRGQQSDTFDAYTTVTKKTKYWYGPSTMPCTTRYDTICE